MPHGCARLVCPFSSWYPSALAGHCNPVLLLRAMQCCPGLLSVRLINVTNNATMNRLVGNKLQTATVGWVFRGA